MTNSKIKSYFYQKKIFISIIAIIFILIGYMLCKSINPTGRYQIISLERSSDTVGIIRLDTVTGLITTCMPADETDNFTRWICGQGPP